MSNLAILIKLDNRVSVFFHPEGLGRNFDSFKIHKFRTMIVDAENIGLQISVGGDRRITKIGKMNV